MKRLTLLPLSIMRSDDSRIFVCLYSCRMSPGPPKHLLREFKSLVLVNDTLVAAITYFVSIAFEAHNHH